MKILNYIQVTSIVTKSQFSRTLFGRGGAGELKNLEPVCDADNMDKIRGMFPAAL